MDFDMLGLKAGIEIHQQLTTREKLFCHCPTVLRKFDERAGEFFRYLRATESELGEIDRAAQEEMKHERLFCYYRYDTTCLVEYDDEPPAPINPEAIEVCCTSARMLSMTPIGQVHAMRKLVIDGSNTSRFQRTALVAVEGILPNGGSIDTICLSSGRRLAGDPVQLPPGADGNHRGLGALAARGQPGGVFVGRRPVPGRVLTPAAGSSIRPIPGSQGDGTPKRGRWARASS